MIVVVDVVDVVVDVVLVVVGVFNLAGDNFI
jgi:hypothetical protein